jgi:hypothetical protein
VAGPALFPDVALVDASLTLDLPADVTYATGLDALSQACESVWSRRATPMTLGVAIEAAQHSLVALEALASGNSDIAVRERMATGSLLAGLAISHSRTSLAHSISYPVTAHFGVPHGIACSFTLPAILRAWASKDDGRLQRLAVALGERGPMGLAERVERLLRRCGVPSVLAQAGVTVQALRALADEMITPGRGDNTFVACSTEDAAGIAVAGFSRDDPHTVNYVPPVAIQAEEEQGSRRTSRERQRRIVLEQDVCVADAIEDADVTPQATFDDDRVSALDHTEADAPFAGPVSPSDHDGNRVRDHH